jgi:hypothetical protein
MDFDVIPEIFAKREIVFSGVEMLSFASIINFIGGAFEFRCFYVEKAQVIKLGNTFLFII